MSNYLNVPSGGGASTPHQAGLVIGASTVDLRARLSADTWAAAVAQTIIDSSDDGDTNARFYFFITVTGTLEAGWYNAAAAAQDASTVATIGSLGIANGSPVWLRVVMAPSAGTFDFYWSNDGAAWTQIGIQLTGYTTTGVNTGGTPPKVAVGQTSNFTDRLLTGKVYRTTILVGAGTVINMDWTSATLGNGTWTSGTGEVWTRFGASSVLASPSLGRMSLVGVGA